MSAWSSRRRLLPVLLCCGCGGLSSTSERPARSPTDAQPQVPEIVSSGEGWGAVFWRGSVAFRVGDGLETVGPRARTTARLRVPPEQWCGGDAIDDAAPHAVLVLPDGAVGQVPTKPAVIPATAVEASAWRLDEALPGRDRFSPVDPDASPAEQRGVGVGSVVKVRRYGGPPVVVVGGRRGEVGAMLVTDRDATTTHASLLVDGFSETPRVLPPTDLDGDGELETALFTDQRVVLARLKVRPATVELTPLESWTCREPAVSR